MSEFRSYRAEAIVLKHHDWGEADRILTAFTREHGKLRVIAKGVRKIRSRRAGHLEPFTHVMLQLAKSKELPIVTQAGAPGAEKGAYVLADGSDVIIIATGCEVSVALAARDELAKQYRQRLNDGVVALVEEEAKVREALADAEKLAKDGALEPVRKSLQQAREAFEVLTKQR